MAKRRLNRRDFLRLSAAAATGAIATACAPATPIVVEKEVIKEVPVEKVVEKVVKETVVVEKEAPPKPREKVKIQWGTPWQGSPPWIMSILDDFAERHPDIEAEYIPIAEFQTKMKTMAASHTLPDVYYLDSFMGAEWAHMGASLPLDDYFDQDLNLEELGEDFLPLSGLYKGKHWMLCNAQGPMGFFYNMDIFDEEGLPYPDETFTWDDMLELATKLTKRKGDQIERYGVQVTRMHSFIWQNGGRYFDESNRCVLDEPASVEAIQWEADLYYKHEVAPLPAALEMQPTTFENGRIAMSWGDGPWNCPSYRKAEFRWDCVPVPQGKVRAVINYGSGMAISSNSKAPDAAWTFAKHWLSELAQITFHSTWESMPILKKTAYDLFVGKLRKETPSNYPIFYEAITGDTKYSLVEPYCPGANSWYAPWGSTFMNEVVSVARTGEKPVSELIGPFVEKFNKWLQENTDWIKGD